MNEQSSTGSESDRDPAAFAPDDPQPRHPAPTESAEDAHPAAPRDAAERSEPKRGGGMLKPLLVGTGAAVVVLGVAGIGMLIADAASNDAQAPVSASEQSEPVQTPPAATPPIATPPVESPPVETPPAGTEATQGSGAGDGTGSDGPSAPASLVAAIDAAVRAAGGGGATSIDVGSQGWEVGVRLDDGSRVDVWVPTGGDPVVSADDDERTSDAPLDPARIPAICAAAIAAAGGGSVTMIETDDEDGRAGFEVEVAVGAQQVDVELAADLTVVAVDR
ncbi:hypothetical protein [Agrococcus sp. Ld7]|uniref:hypothetical protein n=1 Tax=Agrococcus sp. Ld7 TaxID=649148 RepID=UPI0038630AC3